jgi:hypothetical protein
VLITTDVSYVILEVEDLAASIFLLNIEAEYSFETLAVDLNCDNMQ